MAVVDRFAAQPEWTGGGYEVYDRMRGFSGERGLTREQAEATATRLNAENPYYDAPIPYRVRRGWRDGYLSARRRRDDGQWEGYAKASRTSGGRWDWYPATALRDPKNGVYAAPRQAPA